VITLRSIPILYLSCNIEVLAYVLGCLTHRLHAVRGLLVLQDFGMEGFLETVTANGHHFCTHGNADLNAARCNLVRNVLCGLETG
jgi:hypothetical protein